MDAAEAQRFADQWRAAADRGATSRGFAASLQINPATLYNWRRAAEEALEITLPTMTGAAHVASRVRAKAIRMGALPPLPIKTTLAPSHEFYSPLPSYTPAAQEVGNVGAIPEPLAAQRGVNEPMPDLAPGLTSAPEPESTVPCPETADAIAICESQIPNPGPDVPNPGPVVAPTTTVVQGATRAAHRKHYIVPDMQLRPGVPMDHLPWIGADIVRRRPDVIVQIGDWWDMHSLSSHDEPGSLAKEGARYEDDIKAGMDGLELMMRPVLDAIASSDWRPRLIFTEGNHCNRIMRTVNADPRYAGTIGPHHCNVEKYGFERHNFLEVVTVDSISYSHYFQMAGSNRPIGGSMDNRLNKICGSFVQGHEQGLLQHRRPLPTGKTIHGLVCGSAYLHSEDYRGPQRNNEWRGTIVLHDVRNGGDCDPMPLTLQYMAREYGGVELHDLLAAKYPDIPRGWAA